MARKLSRQKELPLSERPLHEQVKFDRLCIPGTYTPKTKIEAKNALSDAKAKDLSKALTEIIGELETVKTAIQIGLPCHRSWRYSEPGQARGELLTIIGRLEGLAGLLPK